MDLEETIRCLREYLAQLNFAIADLERIQKPSLLKRRGRKSMGIDERRLVSKRIKQYWSARRTDRRGGLVG
jgi:hypothetical protein